MVLAALLTWGLGLLGALFLPPVPPGLGLSPFEARVAPLVYPLLQLSVFLLRPFYAGLPQAKRALGLAAWAFFLAEAGFLYLRLHPEPGATGSEAGLMLLARPFFLLLAGLLVSSGWVLAQDPPPPNPSFGAISPRGLADPRFWEKSNRFTGWLMLALGPVLAYAAFVLSFFANLGLALLALGLITLAPALLGRLERR